MEPTFAGLQNEFLTTWTTREVPSVHFLCFNNPFLFLSTCGSRLWVPQAQVSDEVAVRECLWEPVILGPGSPFSGKCWPGTLWAPRGCPLPLPQTLSTAWQLTPSRPAGKSHFFNFSFQKAHPFNGSPVRSGPPSIAFL